MLFEKWKGEELSRINQLIGVPGCKFAGLYDQTSAILRSTFDAPCERRGDARLVLGNSTSFSCFGSVSSVKLQPTNQLVFVIYGCICGYITLVTVSETSSWLEAWGAPNRHQLNVQTMFLSFAELMPGPLCQEGGVPQKARSKSTAFPVIFAI